MARSSQLRVAVFGAGTLGLYLAGRLVRAGQPVTLVVRPGPRFPLPVVVEEGGREDICEGVTIAATWNATVQDLIIAGVKAHQLPAALPEIAPWMGAHTQLLLPQGGLPWWCLQGLPLPYGEHRLRASDPQGVLGNNVDLSRVIACVANRTLERRDRNRVRAPRAATDRFVLGRPHGGRDEVLLFVTGLLRRAGLPAEASADLRPAIWERLLTTVALDPLGAITQSNALALLEHPGTRTILLKATEEAQAVAIALGITPAIDPACRLERAHSAAARGGLRSGMLQDRLTGKTLEIEPTIGALLELARLTRTAAPHLTTLYSCAAALSNAGQTVSRNPPPPGNHPHFRRRA